MTTAADFEVRDIAGRTHRLSEWRGKVLLVVNTASQCGYTPQYAGLEALHKRFAARGLVVMGFPCNQFGGQEPGAEAEIAGFCERNYGVSFPMFAKVDVNGEHAHPLFAWLKQGAPGVLGTQAIKWNFTKFLVGRDGRPITRFAPQDAPETLAPAIEKALAEGA